MIHLVCFTLPSSSMFHYRTLLQLQHHNRSCCSGLYWQSQRLPNLWLSPQSQCIFCPCCYCTSRTCCKCHCRKMKRFRNVLVGLKKKIVHLYVSYTRKGFERTQKREQWAPTRDELLQIQFLKKCRNLSNSFSKIASLLKRCYFCHVVKSVVQCVVICSLLSRISECYQILLQHFACTHTN